MQFEYEKSFGYPVLTTIGEGQDPRDRDYVKCDFQPGLGLRLNADDKSQFLVRYENFVSVPELEALISQKTASYFLYVYCRSTFFSKLVEVGESGTITLEANDLRDLVSLSVFVLAKEDGTLESSKINPEFGYQSFQFSAGQVLAQSAPTTYTVEKDFYRAVNSIIELKAWDELKDGEWVLDTEASDALYVYTSPQMRNRIREFEATAEGKVMILNGFYSQVVTEAIRHMDDFSEDCAEKRWAHVITAKLSSLNHSSNMRDEAHNKSQALFSNPLGKLSQVLRAE